MIFKSHNGVCEPFKSYFRGFEVYERVLKLPDVNAEILFYFFLEMGDVFDSTRHCMLLFLFVRIQISNQFLIFSHIWRMNHWNNFYCINYEYVLNNYWQNETWTNVSRGWVQRSALYACRMYIIATQSCGTHCIRICSGVLLVLSIHCIIILLLLSLEQKYFYDRYSLIIILWNWHRL